MLTTSYYPHTPPRACPPTSPRSPPTSPLHRIRHFLSSPLLPIDEHILHSYHAYSPPDPNLELHSAAASGNVGLVHYALTHGQPVNSVLHGVLPIHAACSGGSVSVVKMLIERGADVNAPRLPRRYSDGKKSNVPSIGAAGEPRPSVAHACPICPQCADCRFDPPSLRSRQRARRSRPNTAHMRRDTVQIRQERDDTRDARRDQRAHGCHPSTAGLGAPQSD